MERRIWRRFCANGRGNDVSGSTIAASVWHYVALAGESLPTSADASFTAGFSSAFIGGKEHKQPTVSLPSTDGAPDACLLRCTTINRDLGHVARRCCQYLWQEKLGSTI